jgi:hypothetical protein
MLHAQIASKNLTIRGFAGADYGGPAPDWLPIIRCNVRAKNGADFLLAFEAGKLAQSCASLTYTPPIVVMVSGDAGLEIIVRELRNVGISSYLLMNVSELEHVVLRFLNE